MPSRFLHLLALITASLGLLAVPAYALAPPKGVVAVTSVEGVDEYRLPNGLQVLMVPDDSKPTTTVNMTYRVGSRMESYGETGMAHLLEHMLFKGTPKHPKVWAEFTKRGLGANGSTLFDRTNYFASFAANDENLKWYLGWQADAMVNSFIARRDLDSEMTVVRNEMESGENNPGRILYQRVLGAMYDWHNYGHDVIGARSDVENVDIPRLQAFYRQYYQPDNATLIVSGRFDAARTLGWIAESFGKIAKPKRKLPVQYTLDPAQDGERSVTLRRQGGVPLIYAAYHVPAAAAADYAAVEVLGIVFGDTPSGRLHKRLVDAQLAASVFSDGLGLAEPSFMLFGAKLGPAQDVDKARAEMVATLDAVARDPVTDEELSRAKAKWLNAWEQAFTDPETVGVSLSESVAQGDWRLFFLMRDRVRELKLADLQRVATQTLLPDNRTVAVYLPTDKPQRAPAPARVDVASALKDFKPQAAATKVETFEATPANIDARTQRFSVGGLQAALLPKGTRGGAVQATLVLHFGDEKSLFGQAAVPGMVAAMLDKGTRTLSRQQIQDRMDALRTEIEIHGGSDRLSVTLNSKREHLAEAIELVGQLLREPVFPAAALDEIKRQSLAAIEQRRKEPGAMIGNAIERLGNPYPRGDVRYARTFDEQVQDVGAVTVEQLRSFHGRFYGLAKAEFGAAGDIDVAGVRHALESAFGHWAAAAPFTRVPMPLVAVEPQRLLLAAPDKQNANMLVRVALPLNDLHADYPAFMMANYLLGAGGSSRLWKRIRETQGLSYDVRSMVSWSSHELNSPWLASAIFAPGNRAKVEAAFREELARALKDGFTAQELAEGQSGLLGFRRLSRAQDDVLARSLANNLYLARTFAVSAKVDEALAHLTLEQVNAALRKYLQPERFVVAFAGDFKD